MGQLCSCFKSTSILPLKEEKIMNSPIQNILRSQNTLAGASKYNSFDEDPKSPGSVISTPRSPYPELRIKIPVEKEIIFDDDNNYRNKKYKKNRLC